MLRLGSSCFICEALLFVRKNILNEDQCVVGELIPLG